MSQSLSFLTALSLLLGDVGFAAEAKSPKPLRVFLNHVTLDADKVVSSLEVFCGSVRLRGVVESKAEVKCGSLVVEGAVNGLVRATCAQVDVRGGVGERGIEVRFGDVNIEGSVRGPVIVTGGNVRVGREARVTGPVIIRGGTFRGDASRVEHGVRVEHRFRVGEAEDALIGWLVGLILLALGLVAFGWCVVVFELAVVAFYALLAFLFRGALERRRELFPTENLGLDLLAGLMVCAAGALVSLPLCCTCVGLPLLVLGFVVAYWFGLVTLAYLVGNYIWRNLFKQPAGFFGIVVTGLLTIQLSRLLPVVGGMLGILYWLAAVGISARWLFESWRARRSPPRVSPTPPRAF